MSAIEQCRRTLLALDVLEHEKGRKRLKQQEMSFLQSSAAYFVARVLVVDHVVSELSMDMSAACFQVAFYLSVRLHL